MASISEEARGYQKEILERAKKQNTIAFLDTGAGKTLVSALLVKHVLEQPESRSRIAVFIVEKVVLVHQQAEYMRDECNGFKVGTYYGDMNLDNWSSERWLEEFSERRILVLTAQIFLNALNHGLIEMTKVAVLVIDEVHHATGEHPFRRIMIDFYHTIAEDKRPKIFGMTASPVKVRSDTKSIADCAEAIANLEVTMDARLCGVSEEGQQELEAIVPTAREFVAMYDSTYEEEEESQAKEDDMAISSGIDTLVPSLVQVSPRTGIKKNRIRARNNAGIPIMHECVEDLDALLRKVHRILGCCVASYLFSLMVIEGNGTQIYDYFAMRNELSTGPFISDQVKVLIDLLVSEAKKWKEANHSDDSFRCIVFVHQRLFAFAVSWIINKVLEPLKITCLKSQAVVGCHAKSSHLRMTQARQNEVLNDFRTGKFGVLVATNVVEEGLDIPACSLVIAFDAVLTAKAYIQARGRARSPGSSYIAMLPRNNKLYAEYISKAYQGAELMKETVKAMNAENGAQWRSKLEAEARKAMHDDHRDMLKSRETSARVLPAAAIPLLNRYVWGLSDSNDKVDAMYDIQKRDNGFVAIVHLPESSPITSAHSSVQSSSQLAKRMAALNAYRMLYEAGEVDKYLLPKLKYEKKNGEAKKYRGTKGTRGNQTVRLCIVEHPPALSRATTLDPETGENIVDESLKPMHLYVIHRQFAPPDVVEPAKWRGNDQFGILTESKIDEDDLFAVICPSKDPLLKLEYVGIKSWTINQRNMCREYMQLVEACSRGHLPQWISNLGDRPLKNDNGEMEDNSHERVNGKEQDPNDSDGDDCTENTETATDADDGASGNKVETKAIRRMRRRIFRENERKEQPPGFYFAPLIDVNGTKELDLESIQDSAAFKVDFKNVGIPSEDWTYSFAVSSHETNDRIYFVANELKGEKVTSKCSSSSSNRFKSIADYYKLRHNTDISDSAEDMLAGHSVSHMLNGEEKSQFRLCRKTCFQIPVNPWAVFTAALLPHWQTFLALRHVWKKVCPENSLEFISFARAVQPNMGNMARKSQDLNYERNEFLGDAVLKSASSMKHYAKQELDEGGLTDFRDDDIGNENLCNIAVENGIQNCIAYTSVTPKAKKWEWYWGIKQIVELSFSEKVLADCIEALIGAHFLEGGLESALKFMDNLDIVHNAASILQEFKYEYLCGDEFEEEDKLERLNEERIAKVEKILEYEFKNKDIVIEALTHGSYASGKANNYQRLEFLGDAVIGFVILSKCFNEHLDFTPGNLSSIREPLLSNDVFARVIVHWGLHEFIWAECDALDKDIEKFVTALRYEKEGEDICKLLTVPKVLGDILESLVGAIFVDQGMQLSNLEEIVHRLIEPVRHKYVNPETIEQHPVSRLSQIVQRDQGIPPELITKEVRKEGDELTSSERNTRKVSRGMVRPNAMKQNMEFLCTVYAQGKILGQGRGPTIRVARHQAALNALGKLSTDDCSSVSSVSL